jgi:hypothetical protein
MLFEYKKGKNQIDLYLHLSSQNLILLKEALLGDSCLVLLNYLVFIYRFRSRL